MSVKIRNIDDFVKALKSHKCSISDAPSSFYRDRESVLKMLPYDFNGVVYNNLSRKLKKDSEFVEQMISVNGRTFLKATKYHKDTRLGLLAAKTCPEAAKCIKLNGENGLDLAKQLVTIEPFTYRHLTGHQDNDEVISLALSGAGILYRYLDPEKKEMKQHAATALANAPISYKFLPKPLKQSISLAKIAISTDGGYARAIYKDMLESDVQENISVSVLACSRDLNCILDVPTQTFEGVEFQQQFKEMIDDKRQEIRQSGDYDAYQDFEDSLSSLFVEKRDMVLKEKIDYLFDQHRGITTDTMYKTFADSFNDAITQGNFGNLPSSPQE